MTLEQTDMISVNDITPDNVRCYLLERGWRLSPFKREQLFVFERPEDDSGEPIIATLPRLVKAPDFVMRARELISVLSTIEGRPPEDILQEIAQCGSQHTEAPAAEPEAVTLSGFQRDTNARNRRSLWRQLGEALHALTEPIQIAFGRMAVSSSTAYLRKHPELTDALPILFFWRR